MGTGTLPRNGMTARGGDRLPPHEIEAEEAVIASALVDPESVALLLTVVRPDDFFREHNRWIWESIIQVFERDGIATQITVASDLAKKKHLKEAGGPAYLARLVTELPTSVGCEHYARIVADTAILRRLISVAAHITRRAHETDDISATLGEAMTLVESVARQNVRQGAVSVRELMSEQADGPPVHQDGVLTGWPNINKLLGSLRRGSLYIVAARPSHGKTSWATSLLRDVLTAGNRKALMFSLEMSRSQIAIRLTASMSKVGSSRIENRVMDEADERRVTRAQGMLGDTTGWLNDRARRLDQIEVEAKAHALKHGVDLLVVDYLQLIDVPSRGSRTEEVTQVSRRLKALAVDMNVPVVALCQLSRAIESRADARPMLSDLRESGAIEQDADAVLFLYDGQKRPDSKAHSVEVIVGKNRLGRVGSVKMTFDPETASFVEE